VSKKSKNPQFVMLKTFANVLENKVSTLALRLACLDVLADFVCRCEGFGKSGCKTCKQAGVDCVFPPSQKRGYVPACLVVALETG